MKSWEAWFEKQREDTLARYFSFLRFQTVSSQAQTYQNEFEACLSWLSTYVKEIGLEVEIWRDPSETSYIPPVLFAEYQCKEKDRPTLLIYHHYDVQPPDPLSLWTSPPFTPVLKEGNVYARGAQDNKGQCSYTLTALRAFFSLVKEHRFNLKLVIEGEEEVGSSHTLHLLSSHKKQLKSDYVLVIDSALCNRETPSITLGLRGIITTEIFCRTADRDMHSGGFGGIAYNPCRILAKALGSLWDEQGKVAVAGFYDHVKTYSPEEKKQYQLEIDPLEMKKEQGIRAFCPEPGYSIGESSRIRPTIEINGIIGGYTGEGFKTVLPASASAKLSCRLVPYQEPLDIFKRVQTHLLKQIPPGIEFTMTKPHLGPPFLTSSDSSLAKLIAKAYEMVYGKPCQRLLDGGSIPMTSALVELAEGVGVAMGMGLYSDQIHAPDEHFGWDRFKEGFLVVGNVLCLLNEKE